MKITKSEFDTKPINRRLYEHIDAHFLICFIALIIIRILQYETNTINNLLEKIKNSKYTHETSNLYKFIRYNSEIQYLNKKIPININVCTSDNEIVEFAKSIGIHPGIVAGRLQHEKIIPQSRCSKLKEKYTIEIKRFN